MSNYALVSYGYIIGGKNAIVKYRLIDTYTAEILAPVEFVQKWPRLSTNHMWRIAGPERFISVEEFNKLCTAVDMCLELELL